MNKKILNKEDFNKLSDNEKSNILKYLRVISDYFVVHHNNIAGREQFLKDNFFKYLLEIYNNTQNAKTQIIRQLQLLMQDDIPIGFCWWDYYPDIHVGRINEICAPSNIDILQTKYGIDIDKKILNTIIEKSQKFRDKNKQGAGTSLLEEAEDKFLELGADNIELHVLSENSALNFYLKCGYEINDKENIKTSSGLRANAQKTLEYIRKFKSEIYPYLSQSDLTTEYFKKFCRLHKKEQEKILIEMIKFKQVISNKKEREKWIDR